MIVFVAAGLFFLGVMVGGRAESERVVCLYDIKEGQAEYLENTTLPVNCERVIQIEKNDNPEFFETYGKDYQNRINNGEKK